MRILWIPLVLNSKDETNDKWYCGTPLPLEFVKSHFRSTAKMFLSVYSYLVMKAPLHIHMSKLSQWEIWDPPTQYAASLS